MSLWKLLLSIFILFFMVSGVSVAQTPDIIKGKVWNRWTSNNFVIHAIADDQGRYLRENIEDIKKWILTRWGLPNTDFDVEVRLWCVDNRRLFEALYPNLKNSRVEVREKDDKITTIEAFLLLDDIPSKVLPEPLTEICIAIYAEKNNLNFGWWVYRGMSLLNGSESQIRSRLKDLSEKVLSNSSVFLSKTLFTTTKEEYTKLTEHEKKMFDDESMVLCLLLRKEFGESRVIEFLSKNDPEDGLRAVYGFRGYKHFDKSFYGYMRDLVKDVIDGKTPTHYLLIQKVKGDN